MNLLRNIIAKSGVKFGTSGARGLVTDFSDEVCAAFTLAFVHVMQRGFEFQEVAIGIDNRPSSPDMAKACASAIEALGLTPVYCGVLPTPALALYAMAEKMPAIMVTGSHIPFDRNGLKFYRPDGEITKDDELAITSVTIELLELPTHTILELNNRAAAQYAERYLSVLEPSVLSGLKIGIYEHSSAGRDLYYRVFEALGADVVRLGRSDQFVPIDTEAVADEDRERARKWHSEYKLDAIFSTDGDGDRPLVANNRGEWLTGDELGLLCSKHLNIKALAVPVSCNTAIEKSGWFEAVERTKIGSPYVIEAFSELSEGFDTVAGFEANGGYMLASDVRLKGQKLSALPTRDALLPALMVIATGEICEQQQLLPRRYTASDRVKNFPRASSLALIEYVKRDVQGFLNRFGGGHELASVDETDGLRMTMTNQDILHIRPSGNAPECRVYVETCSQKESHQLVETVRLGVESLRG